MVKNIVFVAAVHLITSSYGRACDADCEALKKILAVQSGQIEELQKLIPPGTVSAFAGEKIPFGWILCNGQDVSIAENSELYAAIGDRYNAQKNQATQGNWDSPSSGKFRVPDYRGVFLRGAGLTQKSGASITVTLGSWEADSTAGNGLQNSASTVTGTVGGNDGAHTHVQGDYDVGAGGPVIGTRADIYAAGNYRNTNIRTQEAGSGHGHGFNLTAAAQPLSGDLETRPQNKGVNFIIKN